MPSVDSQPDCVAFGTGSSSTWASRPTMSASTAGSDHTAARAGPSGSEPESRYAAPVPPGAARACWAGPAGGGGGAGARGAGAAGGAEGGGGGGGGGRECGGGVAAAGGRGRPLCRGFWGGWGPGRRKPVLSAQLRP